MQMPSILMIACVALGHLAGAAKVNPLSKVVQLLGELEAKIKKDGKAEDKAYEEYSLFCRTSAEDKAHEIKTARTEIEDLDATIGKAVADVAAASSKMEDLTSAVASNDADLQAATGIRAKGKAEFEAAEGELVHTIEILDKAVGIMQRKKGSSLMQAQVNIQDINNLVKALSTVVDAAGLSLHDEKKLLALAQAGSDDDDDEMGAPAKAMYTRKSTGIVDVLEDLKEKANTQLSKARQEEHAAKHNFQMLRQSLTDQIAADNKELAEAKTNNNNAAELKASTEADRAVTSKNLADGEKALEGLQDGCKIENYDHDSSVKSRAEELNALATAKKSLTDNTKKAGGSSYSFFQISTQADLANFEVVTLVKNLAKKYQSSNLLQLAGRIQAVMKYGASAGEDPLKKIKGLVGGMITKLEAEASGEQKHKAYCDKEYAATKAKTEDLTGTVNKLSAKIDKKDAMSAKLHGELSQLQADLTELQKTGMEMTTARTAENKAFLEKKADMEQGLEGVRTAMKVLREYYASDASALVQADSDAPAAPVSHSKSGAASTGIIGMLEVIESDFGRNLAAAITVEDAGEAEYEKTTKTNAVTKKTKEDAIKYKTKEVTQLDKTITDLRSDKSSSQSEFDAVVEYKKTIDSTCVKVPETYEEKCAKRNSEIAGLKEALVIIDPAEESMLIQKTQKGLRGTAVSRHQ